MKGILIFCARNFEKNVEINDRAIANRFAIFFGDLVEICNDYSNEIEFGHDPYFLSCKPDGALDIFAFAEQELDKRERSLFYKILQRAKVFDASYEEIEKMTLFCKGEKECKALVVLNSKIQDEATMSNTKENGDAELLVSSTKESRLTPKEELENANVESDYDAREPYMQFDKYNIIYGKESWLGFKRQILGNHPGCPEDFLKSCNYCFPQIVFGDNCVDNLNYSLSECPRQLVYHLSCMNDKYCDFVSKFPSGHQLNEMLVAFAGKYNFYKAGSKQGSQEGKKSCQYKHNGRDINCEAHWKIQYSDNDHSKKIYVRIYFYHGAIRGETKNLFVGSMSTHA